MIDIKIFCDEGINCPSYKSEEAAGFDIASNDNCVIKAGEFETICTGLYLEIPMGFEGQCRPRSGLAAKHGITVLNAPGTIDSDYRGEIKVILINHSKLDYIVTKRERIAQIVIVPVVQVRFNQVWNREDFTSTARGTGGFGSTGV